MLSPNGKPRDAPLGLVVPSTLSPWFLPSGVFESYGTLFRRRQQQPQRPFRVRKPAGFLPVAAGSDGQDKGVVDEGEVGYEVQEKRRRRRLKRLKEKRQREFEARWAA